MAAFFDRFENRVHLKGTLTALTAFRIGAGRSTAVIGSDLPVVRDAQERPYIPGSSFKGALRAYLESVLRGLRAEWACDPLNDATCCVKLDEAQRLEQDRRDGKIDDRQCAERIYAKSCYVCRTFGSHWIASRVAIRDLLVDADYWFGQFEVRNGVALDRDTETASNGLLYDFEAVPAGTPFRCEIVVENGAPWQLGMLMAGLQPFERGDGVLGGARSRGLGQVELQRDSVTRVGADNLLEFLTGGDPAPVSEEEIRGWLAAFRTELSGQPEAAHA